MKNCKYKYCLLTVILPLLVFGSIFMGSSKYLAAKSLDYRVVKVYPHDKNSFTQGLIWYDNYLYEGSGLYGRSKVVKVDLETGHSLQEYLLDRNDFGEGITIFSNKLYQLTWREHRVYVYHYSSFKKIGEYPWDLEGWGITNDGTSLIVSTGTNKLYFLDPDNLTLIKSIDVIHEGTPVYMLNELEYANGFVYANQYLSNNIWQIDPKTGQTVGVLNLESIAKMAKSSFSEADSRENVLNGIAYNSEKGTFYITGKRWHDLFEIEIF